MPGAVRSRGRILRDPRVSPSSSTTERAAAPAANSASPPAATSQSPMPTSADTRSLEMPKARSTSWSLPVASRIPATATMVVTPPATSRSTFAPIGRRRRRTRAAATAAATAPAMTVQPSRPSMPVAEPPGAARPPMSIVNQVIVVPTAATAAPSTARMATTW